VFYEGLGTNLLWFKFFDLQSQVVGGFAFSQDEQFLYVFTNGDGSCGNVDKYGRIIVMKSFSGDIYAMKKLPEKSKIGFNGGGMIINKYNEVLLFFE